MRIATSLRHDGGGYYVILDMIMLQYLPKACFTPAMYPVAETAGFLTHICYFRSRAQVWLSASETLSIP